MAVGNLICDLFRKQAGSRFRWVEPFLRGYELAGRALRFNKITTSRTACMDGMDQEQAFLKTLEATVRRNIFGEHLEFYGAEGELPTRLESKYLN